MDIGVYELPLTERLKIELERHGELQSFYGAVDDAEQALVITRHLAPIIERSLRAARSVDEKLELTSGILSVLPGAYADGEMLRLIEPGKITQLEEVASGEALTTTRLPRPATPFADVALMTNARNEPTLAAELRAELASADQVDLLCAFVKWQGLRLLEFQLNELRSRDIPVRVITSTYLGATDARALDALVNEFGAQVRVNYETDRTRLHAKAWLLRRKTGFHTAYVGSSNLSHAALVDGLEWNVRLAAMSTPHLLEKFRATFDSYWEKREFEDYRPSEDGDRLRKALETASGKSQGDSTIITLSGLEVRPKPFQEEMLEELDAERNIHDRHRNLVVAATGTGKTVIAALDYQRLTRDVHNSDLSLLFIAHRKEILAQSRRMYQEVLIDPTFGELLVDGNEPTRWRHVFASIQSLTAKRLSSIDPEQFDIVVVDEFHHAEAASYRRLLNHVRPMELLGLTATPERADGVDVREFFDGRVAAELRLWEALEQNLLCPFHYFGIYDGTDLEAVKWRRGGYDLDALSNIYTGDDARVRIVLKELKDKIADVTDMRALGFCVSVEHAHYMAQRFNQANIPALAVSAETNRVDRQQALTALRERRVNILFAVDLFNEGLDIPQVDTVLFLRPTESATVFLQQLGRGLRLTHGKTVLTALDFVGHQRKEFRFDQRFRALSGVSGKALQRQVAEGFPFLPSGSQIMLDSVAQKLVLDNIRQQVTPRWAALVSEVRARPDVQLAPYLDESGRRLEDVLKTNRSWTTLCREAGKIAAPAGPREDALVRRVRALAHVDDRRRWETYTSILSGLSGGEGPTDTRLAKMLFYSLFPSGGEFSGVAEGLATLSHEVVTDEIRQVVDIAFDTARRSTYELGSIAPALSEVPLEVHASYSREEILAALDVASQQRTPSTMREGVAWCESVQADAFFVTLKKSDRDYSPTTMYRDFALSPDLFHWESQSTTSAASPTGQRYINHRERGTHILLFVRAAKTGALGTSPYVFLGPADYVSHEGDRPMAITWRLQRPMPTEVYQASTVAVA